MTGKYRENKAITARRYACFVATAAFVSGFEAGTVQACNSEDARPAIFSFDPCETEVTTFELVRGSMTGDLTGTQNASSQTQPWIASGGSDVPIEVKTGSGGVSARASLDTLRGYNTRAASKSLAGDIAPTSQTSASLQLPKAPATRKLPVDVWSSVNVQGYDQQRGAFDDASSTDQTTRASGGIDYKIDGAANFGVSAERGDLKSATPAAGFQEDAKVAAYMTLRPAPALSLDARTEWQEGNAAFAAATGVAEKNSVTIAPRLDHSFSLDDGNTLQPFVTYKTIYDLSENVIPGATAYAAVTRSAGAGITLNKPDAYSLSVSTDVDGLSAATAPANVNGKFELKVPIK